MRTKVRLSLVLTVFSLIGLLLIDSGPRPAAAEKAAGPDTPDKAWTALLEGNQRYVSNKTLNQNRSVERVREVAEGQNPFAAILGCADSRIPPELVFDQGVGDLFVVRVAGQATGDKVLGSIEYAVAVLGSKVIVVLGHSRCGAVKAAMADKGDGNIRSLVEYIKPAVDRAKDKKGDPLKNTIDENIRLGVEKVNASPVVAKFVKEGKVKVFAAYYDLNTGKVSVVE